MLVEPALNGSGTTIDRVLEAISRAIEVGQPNRDTWGTGRAAEQGADAMMSLVGGDSAPPQQGVTE